MLEYVRRSVSRKLMLVVMATTFLGLVAYGAAMLVYDVRTYHDALVKDLATQANIIAEVSAPALQFNDPLTAEENLALLRTRPAILQAAIYTAEGTRFADYASREVDAAGWPSAPQLVGGYTIEGDRIMVWRRIVQGRNILGTVYIRARYQVWERLTSYVVILACVMSASLALAALVAVWLKGTLTKPVFAVTNVARQVMQSRDFSLRAEKHTEDEIGVLVEAFNKMLSEVERRARALEQSNRSLEHEMGERQAAEQALRSADRRKDEFLATLAHELRNPLAPLLTGLRILRMSKGDPDAAEKAQVIMERQLQQMVRLVDDLLDVSRITTGKLTISKERVPVQTVMQAALEATSAAIEWRGHVLRTDFPPEPLYVEADSVRLAQVFSNLLNNAAKYTDPGGHIAFKASEDDRDIIVEVSDDGIGIAPEMLHEIFDMFIQVDTSLERAHAGLGVGLALSKRLIELHGGSLEADSEGVGRGSRFAVRLPKADTPAAAEEPAPPSYSADKSHFRILLVDDNVDFVTTMSTLLTALGHEVRTAHDGATALNAAPEFKPDYAFLDIGMPGMNGYDLARRLRELPALSDTVLVAVTGWGQEKDRNLSRAAGFDRHLVKPIDLPQVLEVLEGREPFS